MGSNSNNRLSRLMKSRKAPQNGHRTPCPGVFVLKDGTAFMTPIEPLDYLLDHGAKTSDGKRIVGYKLFPQQEEDFMSLILKMLVDNSIRDLNGGNPCQTRNL